MSKTSTLEDYKFRLMVYKQWKLNVHPKQAVQNINISFVNKNSTTFKEVHYWYCQFKKDDKSIFDQKSSLQLYSSNTHSENASTHLLSSLFLLTDQDYCCENRDITINNGRFLILFDQGKKYKYSITIHDLFRGTKRISPAPRKMCHRDFTIFGQYLLAAENFLQKRDFIRLHALKINYDDLSVEQFKSVKINGDFDYADILTDQSNCQKFVIYSGDKIIDGQIHNDKFMLKTAKNIKKNRIHKERLFDNTLQGFEYSIIDLKTLKFCELNLETMKRKEIKALIELDNDELNIRCFTSFSCWSLDRFYSLFSVGNGTRRLLSFDTKTFRWIDVQIWARTPKDLSVDENDIVTFRLGNYTRPKAFYRVALRKPDTLMNLTQLAALKESNFYGNDKYLNAVKSLPIKL